MPQPNPCEVCGEFLKAGVNRSDFFIRVSDADLHVAAERGCLNCSLVSKAIKVFGSYVTSHSIQETKLLKINDNKLFSTNGEPRLLLAFQGLDGVPREVTLDIFTPIISSDAPIYQAPNCVSSKLCLSDLVSKIDDWIQNCESKHIHCRVPDCPILPSRVIDVGVLESYDDVKLVLGRGSSARYSALSYCWGNGASMIQTTSSSLARWTEGIPWQQLPKTFQDAITLTRKLGIQYLWIDALCIVQDDNQDWEFESANMANVYSNSYITIAATSAANSHHGLFADRWTRSQGKNSLKVPVDAHCLGTSENDPHNNIFVRPQLSLVHSRFCNMENAMDHIEDAPLLTRAWALQERLLPARTLHFHAEELVWECKSTVSCECMQLDRWYGFEPNELQGYLKNFVTGSLHNNESVAVLGHVWLDLVSEFGALGLTHETDRLPALSGLASKFSNKCLGNYMAGIWEHDIARGLLFETATLENGGIVQQSQLASPSWSWASAYLHGSRISYNHIIKRGFIQDPSFRIPDVDLKQNDRNPLSWIEHGISHFEGRCALASWRGYLRRV